MNAPDLFRKMKVPTDGGLALRLKTLTPLYTGGIGQEGDQVHPSNLLGGVRHFSCLVARTLGETGFESKVWGGAGQGGIKAEGKQVALHWDLSRLKAIRLPGEIKVPKKGGESSRWWFNTAFEGELDLALTRRGISDLHWQILQYALAIQVRHATFGAKDQFGLGVLGWREQSFVPAPLDTLADWPQGVVDESKGQLNLLRYGFFKLGLSTAPGQRQTQNKGAELTLGLTVRSALRNALRGEDNATDAEKERLKALRHRMLGKLNQFGSATNVSAAYPATGGGLEVRIAVALKPEDSPVRTEIMTRFSSALKGADYSQLGYRLPQVSNEFGGAHLGKQKKVTWLNKLAGV